MGGLLSYKVDSDTCHQRNNMPSALTNRPKITKIDITNGYVNRYFARFISNKKIIEIDEKQYDKFQGDSYHQTLQLKWIIGGTDLDVTTSSGQVIRGAKYQNIAITEFYNKKMPGLKSVLSDPLEFFIGTKVDT